MMMPNPKNPLDYLHNLSRYRFLTLLNAATKCEEHLFAKQAAMLWLVNYPGDLYVQYLQANTLANIGNVEQATKNLLTILDYDPEFIDPYQTLTAMTAGQEDQNQLEKIANYLSQASPDRSALTGWIDPLWRAREAYSQKSYEEAILLIHESMVGSPTSPLPAILHLKIAYKLDNPEMINNLGEIYLDRWPNCLQVNIIKALSEMASGQETQAVERLHWIAAHDSTGQVIQRLMGENHRFRNLWPEQMEIFFDLPIPSPVNGYLGWNQLQSGEMNIPEFKQHTHDAPRPETISQEPKLTIKNPSENPDDDSSPAQQYPPTNQSANTVQLESNNNKTGDWATQEDFEEIQQTFSKLAKRFKKSDLDRAENRYPVYVVLTSKKQLETVYGPNTSEVIHELLSDLISQIQRLPEWGALLYTPDDPALMSQYGLKPKIASDAWQIKLALADLDAALADQGEMIGALLIVGGPEIVPFHHLPNPTHDSDLNVVSDNPYSTVDENYFIPQWPVGRLPGESGPDAGLLLEQIRNLLFQYEKRSKNANSKTINFTALITWIINIFKSMSFRKNTQSLGYSAEIWQEAARGVYKAIDKPHDLILSPPTHSGTLLLNGERGHRLGYFNLHGVKDGPNWYGQKDFTSLASGPDYPVALSPTMFNERQASPELLLSEACYGANVIDKRHEEALSLKCLDSGTRSFIGSTCIAYGSVTLPLIAADYLAEVFWQKIKSGEPAGYALMQAKLWLAEEMTRVQGFLDGEDQKTILSFVLYGDPLAVHDGIKTMPKPMFRLKTHPAVRTVSDSELEPSLNGQEMPKNVDKQVKKLTEKYLPGLQNAQMRIDKSASTSINKNQTNTVVDGRYVVTLQKSFDENQRTTHHHFARMTFDKKGKLIKFSTSR
jgi:tetratricopeptide (TPR) repeat protein